MLAYLKYGILNIIKIYLYIVKYYSKLNKIKNLHTFKVKNMYIF